MATRAPIGGGRRSRHEATGLEQLCVERGLRMGDKRRAILQVLDAAGDHLTAEELHQRVVQTDDRICLSTVYRTISLLISAGILTQLDLGDGKKRYEAAGGGRHEHLIDLVSGQVSNFCDPEVEALLRDAVEKLGYRLVDYRLDVFAQPLSEPDAPPNGDAES